MLEFIFALLGSMIDTNSEELRGIFGWLFQRIYITHRVVSNEMCNYMNNLTR